jgi:hypothetical protein
MIRWNVFRLFRRWVLPNPDSMLPTPARPPRQRGQLEKNGGPLRVPRVGHHSDPHAWTTDDMLLGSPCRCHDLPQSAPRAHAPRRCLEDVPRRSCASEQRAHRSAGVRRAVARAGRGQACGRNDAPGASRGATRPAAFQCGGHGSSLPGIRRLGCPPSDSVRSGTSVMDP